MSQSSSSEKEPKIYVPDGGWGWVVTAATFVMYFFIQGSLFSISVMFESMINELGCSRNQVNLMASICFGLQCLGGFFVGILDKKFGPRRVAVTGGVCVGTGYIISGFAQNIYMLYVSFGIVGGLGMSMGYFPTMVLLTKYFDTKISLTSSIACVGCFVGCFVMPYIMEAFLQIYGWRSAMILTGAVVWNSVAAALLLLPVEKTSLPQSPSEDNLEDQSEALASLSESRLDKMNENSSLLKKTLLKNTIESAKDMDKSTSSLDDRSISHSSIESVSKEPMTKQVPNASFRQMQRFLSHPGEDHGIKTLHSNFPYGSARILYGNSLTSLNSDRRRPIRSTSKLDVIAEYHSRLFLPSLYIMSTPSVVDLPVIEKIEEAEKESDDGSLPKKHSNFNELVKSYSKLLCNVDLLAFSVANFFICACLWVPSVFIVDWGTSIGLDSGATTALLSMVGIGNIIGRPIVALIADKFRNHRVSFFAILCLIPGVLTGFLPFFANAYVLVILVIEFTVFVGGALTLLTPVLVDIVPRKDVREAFAVMLFAEGLGMVSGPPLLGYIPSYTIAFLITGVLLFLGGLVTIFIVIRSYFRQSQSPNSNDNTTETTTA